MCTAHVHAHSHSLITFIMCYTLHGLIDYILVCCISLIPRPLPDFSPRLRDKIREWPEDEASVA